MSNVPQVANVRTRVTRLMPLTLVIVGAVSFVVVYAVMTGTRGGRSMDAEWTDRALPSSSSGFSRSSAVMRTMAPSHVVFACVPFYSLPWSGVNGGALLRWRSAS